MEHATKEFLEKGYQNTSMRVLAAKAGVTTGAIYRYFENKESLFQAVTQSALDAFYEMYNRVYHQTIDDTLAGISYLDADPKEGSLRLAVLYDLIYEQFDQFYLLIKYSEETSMGSFLHGLIQRETDTWVEFIELLKKKYHSEYEIHRHSLYTICQVYITAIFDPIFHKMDKETAIAEADFFRQFFIDGCLGIERIIKGDQ